MAQNLRRLHSGTKHFQHQKLTIAAPLLPAGLTSADSLQCKKVCRMVLHPLNHTNTGASYVELLCAVPAGLAGAVSRTATAPIDRLKMLLQIQDGAQGLTLRGGLQKIAAEGERRQLYGVLPVGQVKDGAVCEPATHHRWGSPATDARGISLPTSFGGQLGPSCQLGRSAAQVEVADLPHSVHRPAYSAPCC